MPVLVQPGTVYNSIMARGWESKSVEQQVEDARTESQNSAGEIVSPEDSELFRKKEGLMLLRSRILQEIGAARNPRYRKLLEEMLRHVEHELSSRRQ